MEKQIRRTEEMEQKGNKKKGFQVALILVSTTIISIAVALLIHNLTGSTPAHSEIKNGLSAYELAVQYGYEPLKNGYNLFQENRRMKLQ